MSILADIVMCGWVPAVLLLFMVLQPHRAVVASYIIAWLFLPNVSYSLPGLPDYTKMSATSLGVLFAVLVFHYPTLKKFRFHWCDIPVCVLCITPLMSSISNELGSYDGISGLISMVITWGIPYLIGRVFLGSAAGIRELTTGIVLGGLVYVPLCLVEMRMAPQISSWIYGTGTRWDGALRMGGWRPQVFLESGLPLGMWMTCASLIAFWLWKTKNVTRLFQTSFGVLTAALLVTTILCRSTGALALLIAGIGVLLLTKWIPSRVWLFGLIALTPLYIGTRITGIWNGEGVLDVSRMISEDRAESFQFRLDNEDILIEKAMQRPMLGWAGWGRNRVYDEWGKDLSITDGLWVIELGTHGIVGMLALICFLLLGPTLYVMKTSPSKLVSREYAPFTCVAIIVVLTMLDLLPNAMNNPIIILACGSLMAMAAQGVVVESLQDAPCSIQKPVVVTRKLRTGGCQ